MASKPQHRVSKPKKGGEKYGKPKGGVSFEAGDSAIFLSCDKGKESKCSAEAMDLFTESYEKSLGKEVSSDGPSNGVNHGDDEDEDDIDIDDIEAQIKKEVEGLKPKASTPRLFQKVPSNVPCMVFLRCHKSIDPVKLVHDICIEARANPGQRRSRWIKRMIPITQIRKILSVDLDAFAKEVLRPHFHAEAVSKKFAIRPSIRSNDTFDRDIVIKTVAAAVGPNHKVDLTNNDHTILVEVAKNIIGMSVVGGDYDELKRFNLSEIYNPTPRPQKTPAS